MLIINLDTDAGIAKPVSTAPLRAGVNVPVQIICANGSPGTNPAFQLGLCTDAAPPAVLSFLDVFAPENESTFLGVLNNNDPRLLAFMASKSTASVNVELHWTVDGSAPGERITESAPNFKVTVEPTAFTTGIATEGGPVYLTQTEILALLASYAQIGTVQVPDRDNGNALKTLVIKDGVLAFES